MMLSARSPVLGRRHACRSSEGAGEARLRRESGIQSNLPKRCASHGNHGFGALETLLADITVRRQAYCSRKRTGKMKDAEACDIGEIGDGNLFSEMLFDISKNAPQSCIIQPIS